MIYFVLWVLLIPFLASVTWLTLDRLIDSSQSFAHSLSDALFAAPFGVVFSFIMTIPLSIVVLSVSRIFRTSFARGSWTAGLAFLLTVIGSVWALFIVRDSGFQGTGLRTLLVGGFAGLLTGIASVLLLRLPKPEHRIP
ncbi:MAG TPA: hypothetical protein VN673_06920 [Clostridia bacterium]|nr:hypothetical protein [Clostridia bacterium]